MKVLIQNFAAVGQPQTGLSDLKIGCVIRSHVMCCVQYLNCFITINNNNIFITKAQTGFQDGEGNVPPTGWEDVGQICQGEQNDYSYWTSSFYHGLGDDG